jgi:hypothetical protein
MGIEKKHMNPFGGIPGGVYASAIDTAAYWSAYCDLPEEKGLVSIIIALPGNADHDAVEACPVVVKFSQPGSFPASTARTIPARNTASLSLLQKTAGPPARAQGGRTAARLVLPARYGYWSQVTSTPRFLASGIGVTGYPSTPLR